MTIAQEQYAVADAPVGTNLANGKFWANSKNMRMISGVALVGSAAAGDCKLSIYYGTTKMMEIENSSTGVAVDTDKDLIPHNSNLACQPNDSISVIVDKAPITNPIKLLLVISEVPGYSRRY